MTKNTSYSATFFFFVFWVPSYISGGFAYVTVF